MKGSWILSGKVEAHDGIKYTQYTTNLVKEDTRDSYVLKIKCDVKDYTSGSV